MALICRAYLWIPLLLIPLLLHASPFEEKFREAVIAYNQGKYEESLNRFLDAEVENPEEERVIYGAGNAQFRLGKFSEAVESYKRVIERGGDMELVERAMFNLGNSLYRQGKLEEAVEWYRKALEIDPEDEDARKNLEFVMDEIKRRINEALEREKEEDKKKEDADEKDADEKEEDEADKGKEDKKECPLKKEGEEKKEEAGKREGGEEKEEKAPGQEGAMKGADEGGEEPLPAPGRASPMSKEEAEMILQGIEEDPEKGIKGQLRGIVGIPIRPTKDW